VKKVFVYVCLILIATGIVTVFWKQEMVYALPTPVPHDFKPVATGQHLLLPLNKHSKPLFLHFFNPACPCSRFNMKHFKTLVHEYGKRVDFRIVVQTQDSTLSAENIKSKFDVDLPCIIDRDKKIAGLCGVYSTPQAVIIDAADNLYYKGNYNRARYCTDKKSDFAQMALDSLLKDLDRPVFSVLATRPYGCSLPSCKK
jgi:hypothetical protein